MVEKFKYTKMQFPFCNNKHFGKEEAAEKLISKRAKFIIKRLENSVFYNIKLGMVHVNRVSTQFTVFYIIMNVKINLNINQSIFYSLQLPFIP